MCVHCHLGRVSFHCFLDVSSTSHRSTVQIYSFLVCCCQTCSTNNINNRQSVILIFVTSSLESGSQFIPSAPRFNQSFPALLLYRRVSSSCPFSPASSSSTPSPFHSKLKTQTFSTDSFRRLPLLSQERVIKLRTLIFERTFTGSIRTKAMKNLGKCSRGRSQGVPKIFRASIARSSQRQHSFLVLLVCVR